MTEPTVQIPISLAKKLWENKHQLAQECAYYDERDAAQVHLLEAGVLREAIEAAEANQALDKATQIAQESGEYK